MNTLEVTYKTLIDRALLELQAPAELGYRVSLTDALLDDPDDNTVTLADATNVNVSDVLELGSELVLVTAKTTDAIPVVSICRAYYGTTIDVHASGDVAVVNPLYPRVRVGEAIRRSFARLEALGLPLLVSETFNITPNYRYVEMPEATREVIRVGYWALADGSWHELANWRYFEDLPSTRVASGKIVRVPTRVPEDVELDIVYRVPYRWSNDPEPPVDADTIEIAEGAEDLPAIYAVAWLVGAREVARTQIDRSEEWNVGEPLRNGVSLSLLKLKWQDFYRALDEARRLVEIPKNRPYVRTPR